MTTEASPLSAKRCSRGSATARVSGSYSNCPSTHAENPFGSTASTASSLSANPSQYGRLAAPIVLTVRVPDAASRQTHPKSTGRFCSRFVSTTWKILARSWRSLMARVMCCSRLKWLNCTRRRLSELCICVSMWLNAPVRMSNS